jgi:APA family basic amino acid/polyamine antiporter
MATETTPAMFERRASGLVREAGTLDVLIYNINFVSLGLMAALVFLFSTAFYPGANLYLTAILTFLLVIPRTDRPAGCGTPALSADS